MPLEEIEFKGHRYPKFQSIGRASRFAIPYAKMVCKGEGYDIGYNREEWKLEGAFGIDLGDTRDSYHADLLPDLEEGVDYIFSSHCLEHVPNWSKTLTYWISKLKVGGVLFLYLPDFSQVYWRPWHNNKHHHCLTPEILRGFLEDCPMVDKVYVSGVDLNHSFMVMCERVCERVELDM